MTTSLKTSRKIRPENDKKDKTEEISAMEKTGKKNTSLGKSRHVGRFAKGEIMFDYEDGYVVKLISIGSKPLKSECYGKLEDVFEDESDIDIGAEINCRIWNTTKSKTEEYTFSYILTTDPMFMNEDVVFKETHDVSDIFYGRVSNFVLNSEDGGKYFTVSHFNVQGILPCEHLRSKKVSKFLSAKSSTSVEAVVLEKQEGSYVLGLAGKSSKKSELEVPAEEISADAKTSAGVNAEKCQKQFRLIRKEKHSLIVSDNEIPPNIFSVDFNHLHDNPWACSLLHRYVKLPFALKDDPIVLDAENSIVSLKSSLISKNDVCEDLKKDSLFVGYVQSMPEFGCFVKTQQGSNVLIPKQFCETHHLSIGQTIHGKIMEADSSKKRYVGVLAPMGADANAYVTFLRNCLEAVQKLRSDFNLKFLEKYMLGSVFKGKINEIYDDFIQVSLNLAGNAWIPTCLMEFVPNSEEKWPREFIVVGYDSENSLIFVAPFIRELSENEKGENKTQKTRVVYSTSEFYVCYSPKNSRIVLFSSKTCYSDVLETFAIGDDLNISVHQQFNETISLGTNSKLKLKTLEEPSADLGQEVKMTAQPEKFRKSSSFFEEMQKMYPIGKLVDARIESIRATFLNLSLPSFHPAKMFVGHFKHQRQTGEVSAHLAQDRRGDTIKAIVIGYKRFKHSQSLQITSTRASSEYVLLRNSNIPLNFGDLSANQPYLYTNELIEADTSCIKYRPDENEIAMKINSSNNKIVNMAGFIESCFDDRIVYRLSPSIVVTLELGLCSTNVNHLNNHGKCFHPGAQVIGKCAVIKSDKKPNLPMVKFSVVEKPKLVPGTKLVARISPLEKKLEVPLFPGVKFHCKEELENVRRFFNCTIVEKKDARNYVVKLDSNEKKQENAEKKSTDEKDETQEVNEKKKQRKDSENVETEQDHAEKTLNKKLVLETKGLDSGVAEILTDGLKVGWSDDEEIDEQKNQRNASKRKSQDPDMVNDAINSDEDDDDDDDDDDATAGTSDDDSDLDPPSKKAKLASKENNSSLRMSGKENLQNGLSNSYELAVLSEPNSAQNWIDYMKCFMNPESPSLIEVKKLHERAMTAMDDLLYDERLKVSITLLEAELQFGTQESIDDSFSYAVQRNNPLEVHLKMAALYSENKNLKKAAETYKLAIKKFKNDKRTWLSYLEHLYRNRKFDDAANLVSASFASLTKQEHIEIIMKTASLEFEFGETERGKTSMEHLLSTYPKNTSVWDHYMELLYAAKDHDGVREVFGRLLSLQLRKYKLMPLFKKFLSFEEQHGTKEQLQSAQDKYKKFFASESEKESAETIN